MLNKKILILAILIVSLFAVSTVSAANNATDNVVSLTDVIENTAIVSTYDINGTCAVNDNDDVSVENQNIIGITDEKGLSSTQGTFTDLDELISNGGNEINLTKDYIYTKSIDLNKNNGIDICKQVIINGNGHVISGNNNARAFNIQTSNVVLKNISFVDCTVSSSSNSIYGGAIYWNGANGMINNCNFTNCNIHTSNYFNKENTSICSYGGAVYWNGDNGYLVNCTFISCSAESDTLPVSMSSGTRYYGYSYSYGGAVYWNGENGEMSGSSFEKCYSAASANIPSSVTYYNRYGYSYTYGGAIYWGNSLGNLNNCNFSNCYCISNSTGHIKQYHKIGSKSYGGTIYWSNYDGIISFCNFKDSYAISQSHNDVSGLQYNDVLVSSAGSVTYINCNMENCTFEQIHNKGLNKISDNQGSTRISSGWLNYRGNLNNCTFKNIDADSINIVDQINNCKFINCTGSMVSTLSGKGLENFIFINCSGYMGSCYDGNMKNFTVVNCQNGGLDLSGKCSLTDSNFINSSCPIYVYGNDVSVSNCNFINGTGNCISIDFGKNININSCTFVNNSYKYDGIIQSYGSNHCISNCTFINNTARYGGAIYFACTNGMDGLCTENTIKNCNFIGNTALQGGAIYIASSNSLVYNCNFTNNSANNGSSIYWSDTHYYSAWTNGAGEIVEEITIFGGDKGTLYDCNFIDNMSSQNTIYWNSTDGIIYNVTFNREKYNYQDYIRADCKIKPNLTVKANDTNLGEEIIVHINQLNNLIANNELILYKIVNNRQTLVNTWNISCQNSPIERQLTNLTPGKYLLNAKYGGDKVYRDESSISYFDVFGENLQIDISLNKNSFVANDTLVITIALLNDSDGEILINFQNKEYTDTIINGTTMIEIPNIKGGNSTYTIYYSGNNKYNPKVLTNVLDVKYKENSINLNLKQTYEYGEDIILKPIMNEHATGNISIYLLSDRDYFYNNLTEMQYVATFNITDEFKLDNILPANYSLKLIYNSDGYFEDCEYFTMFYLRPPEPQLTINDVNTTLNSNTLLTVYVSYNNNTINKGNVYFYIDEAYINKTSVFNNVATFSYIPKTPGNHKIKVEYYSVDGDYSNSMNSSSMFVNTILIDLEFENTTVSFNTSIVAKITDLNGKPIESGSVTFYFENGEFYQVPIKNGTAKMYYIPNEVGNYRITANFDGNDIYGMFNTSKILNVSQGNTYLVVEDINATINKETLFFVKVISDSNDVDQGSLNFYMDDEYIDSTPIVPGYGCIYYTPNIGGEHIITVTYDGYGLNYRNTNTTFKIFIDSLDISLIAENLTVGYENELIVNLTTLSGETIDDGFVSLYVDGNLLEKVSVQNGVVFVNYVPLTFGNHIFNVSYSEGSKFLDSEISNIFTINQADSKIIVDDINGIVSHKLTITANVVSSNNLTINEGIVTFFDDDIQIGKSSVNNGVATLTYVPTYGGEHHITTIFSTTNYLSSNDTAKLLVDSTSIEILVNNGTVGYNSTLVADVKGLYSIINEGNVMFYIDDEHIGTVPIINGSASLSYTPLTAKDYIIKAIFTNSSKFLDDVSMANFKVNKANSEIIISDINATFGQEITILVNVVSSNNLTINEGYVVFFDYQTNIGEANVNNGIARLTYAPTNAGEHPITAMFYANNYDDNINSALLNVSKASVDLSIDNILDVDFKEQSKFTVHVTSNYNVINEGEIKFYVNDSLIGSSDIYDGVANFEYAANGGSSILTVVYEENDNYLASSQTANFVVNAIPSTLFVNDITAYYNDGSYLLVKLVDSSGVPISGVDVLVYLDGVKTLVTDNDGQIRVSINGLAPKTYVTKVAFGGNANYAETNTFVNVVIHKAPSCTVIDDLNGIVGHELKITVNVVNYVNNLTIGDGKVVFFDGETNIGESNVVNGSAILTYIPLYAGSHNVKAVYCDSIYFTDSEKTASLTVDKADSKILINNTEGTVDHEVSLTVNVVSSNNLTIDDGKVVFFDGETNIGEANVANGMATLIYAPTTAGNHSITAWYHSNNYQDAISSALLTVAKANIDLTISKIDSVYFTNPSNFIVNINSNSKPVNEGKIKYYVNNEYIGIADVFNGNSKSNYITNGTGFFTLTVVYDESENYLSANTISYFEVNRMPTTLTGESVIFDEEALKTFTTELKDTNNLGVNGKPVRIEVIKYSGESATFNGISDANGITIYDVGRLAGGMWYVTGIYAGDENYIDSRFADKFIVVRIATTTVIEEIENPKVNHTYKLKANIHDENGKLVKDGILQFYLDGVDIGSIDLSKNQGHQNALNNGVLGAINPIFAYELGADEEASDLFIEYIPTKAGKHTLTAVYEGTTIYKASNQTTTFIVSEESNVEPEIIIPPLDEPSEDGSVTITLPSDATGTVTLNINGQNYTFDVENGVANLIIPNLGEGNYPYTITYSGDNKYSSFNSSGSLNVNNTQTNTTGGNVSDDNSTGGNVSGNTTVEPEITIPSFDETSEGGLIPITLPADATGTVTLTVGGKDYVFDVVNGVANVKLPDLNNGDYPYIIKYSGDIKYSSFATNGSLKVNNTPVKPIENTTDINGTGNATSGNETKPTPEIIIPPLDEPSADGSVAINLPNDATGTVTLTVDGKNYTFDVKNGVANVKLPELGDGNYNYTITYSGDNKYSSFSTNGNMKVNNTKPEDTKPTPEIVIPPLDEPSSDGSVTITLPSDATGKVTLSINGKSYNYLVENGVANVIIPNLGEGDYPYTITYSGDSKYSTFTTNGSLNKPAPKVDPKITAKNTAVQYSAKGKYSVTVYGTDGKVASGVQVIFKISGKQVGKAKTNSKGVASYVVTKNPGKYKIQATALGKSITKTVTVKHIVTLKTVTLKKSAKKLTLQATLAKVNGKYLKKKTVTFKINGKKVATAKTNSKGVAKITIKNPNVVKKLKVGKKVTYQATYLKDTVKKTAKVKK